MNKISLVGIQARDKGIKGMSFVANAVKSTTGPFGLNALTEKGRKSSNDGFFIGTELIPTIEDEFERLGAQIAGEGVSDTNYEVGDFTSGTWALQDSITKELLRYLPTEKSLIAKKSPAEIAKMVKEARTEVIKKLQESTVSIKDEETLIKSALVAVEDEEIARMLGKMQWELGPNGRIIAEEVNQDHCSIEKVNGIRLDNGFSNATIINNPEKETFEVSNSPILLTNYTIGVEEIMALKESIITPLLSQKKHSLIIMARAFTSEAIKLCVETTQTGFALFPINAPYTDQRERMKDIEAVVGGRYLDSEEATLKDIYITDIGFCERLVAGRFFAEIAGTTNEQSKVRIEKRVEELTLQAKGAPSDFRRNQTDDRISQLTSGFAILKVGSESVPDRKRLKDKCDDAVNSVRLALKGGTVKGGGLAFKEISDQLPEDNILKRPITVIYDQIMSTAPEGFEIEDWVRDPFITLECGLKNACNTSLLLTRTNIMINTKNPKEKCSHEE